MIQSVEERGGKLLIRGENNKIIGTINLAGGEMQNYTSNSIVVKRGKSLYIYNEKGNIKTVQRA